MSSLALILATTNEQTDEGLGPYPPKFSSFDEEHHNRVFLLTNLVEYYPLSSSQTRARMEYTAFPYESAADDLFSVSYE